MTRTSPSLRTTLTEAGDASRTIAGLEVVAVVDALEGVIERIVEVGRVARQAYIGLGPAITVPAVVLDDAVRQAA